MVAIGSSFESGLTMAAASGGHAVPPAVFDHFPYDPYELESSRAHLSGMYRAWKPPVEEHDSDESDSGDDGEDGVGLGDDDDDDFLSSSVSSSIAGSQVGSATGSIPRAGSLPLNPIRRIDVIDAGNMKFGVAIPARASNPTDSFAQKRVRHGDSELSSSGRISEDELWGTPRSPVSMEISRVRKAK